MAPGSFGLPGYAELQCFSNFTFLRGASHAEELAARAAQLGYEAIAITDECSLRASSAHTWRQRKRASSCTSARTSV